MDSSLSALGWTWFAYLVLAGVYTLIALRKNATVKDALMATFMIALFVVHGANTDICLWHYVQVSP